MNIGLYSSEGDTFLINIIKIKGKKALIEQLTDFQGNITKNDFRIIDKTNIVSLLPLRTISPNYFIHFTSNGKIKASEFVTEGTTLAGTTSHGFGSGIYGLHFKHENVIERFKSSVNQVVYKITCSNPFMIQDESHSGSITVASMATNTFLDKITAADQIKTQNIDNVVNLWNIVFFRSDDYVLITSEVLKTILYNYFVKDSLLKDTRTGQKVKELPINSIFRYYNYDGLLGDDAETNAWSKGCISYDYDFMDVVIEGRGGRIHGNVL
jgi:hypothetical protein